MKTLLEVENLTVAVNGRKGSVELVKNVSFELEEGRCLGVLGESGSGKSLTCRSILRLLAPKYRISGAARFGGRDLLGLDSATMRFLRGSRICMILQNPMASFDPLCTIGSQMAETILEHDRRLSGNGALRLSGEMLERMRIRDPGSVLQRYPHQLSGGMLQRVMIALALVTKPGLIVADEPTTALDAVTQHEVLKEFARIRREEECSMIFVTHDLGVLSRVADTLIVMHDGEIVERGTLPEIFAAPRSEQARYLLETRMAVMRKFESATRPSGSRSGDPAKINAVAGF